MKQSRRAPVGFQIKSIQNLLGRHDISRHEFDIQSEIDPSLRLSENTAHIKKMLGIGREKTSKEYAREEHNTLIDQCMRTESKTDCGDCCTITKDPECCDIARPPKPKKTKKTQVKKYNFSERVSLYGASKRRWRCPKCLRAFRSDGECPEHGGIEYAGKPLDLKTVSELDKWNIVEIELTDLFSNRYPQKKQWTLQEIHNKTGFTMSFLKGNADIRLFMTHRGITIKPPKKATAIKAKPKIVKVKVNLPLKSKGKPSINKGLNAKTLTDKQIQTARKKGYVDIFINGVKKRVTKHNYLPRKQIVYWYKSGSGVSLKRMR